MWKRGVCAAYLTVNRRRDILYSRGHYAVLLKDFFNSNRIWWKSLSFIFMLYSIWRWNRKLTLSRYNLRQTIFPFLGRRHPPNFKCRWGKILLFEMLLHTKNNVAFFFFYLPYYLCLKIFYGIKKFKIFKFFYAKNELL